MDFFGNVIWSDINVLRVGEKIYNLLIKII